MNGVTRRSRLSTNHRRRGALDLAGVAHVDRAHLYPERWRQGLDGAELSVPGRIAGISKDCRHVWRDSA